MKATTADLRAPGSWRRKPYTERGLERLTCFRAGCTNQAYSQWNICADGPYRPVCRECDVELNRMVLEWAGFPDAAEKIARYRAERLRQ